LLGLFDAQHNTLPTIAFQMMAGMKAAGVDEDRPDRSETR
jgi:hypothetical protein